MIQHLAVKEIKYTGICISSQSALSQAALSDTHSCLLPHSRLNFSPLWPDSDRKCRHQTEGKNVLIAILTNLTKCAEAHFTAQSIKYK